MVQWDDQVIYFLVSILFVLILFLGYYLKVGHKLESRGKERIYLWGVIILILLAWLFPITVNIIAGMEINWYIYGYAVSITLAFLGVYYFITRLRRLNARWKTYYGNEDGWIKAEEAEPTKIGIIRPTNAGNETWNILAPLEILETDWFDKFYNFIGDYQPDPDGCVKIIETGKIPSEKGEPKYDISVIQNPALGMLKRAFKFVTKYAKKYYQKQEDKRKVYEKATPVSIIQDLQSIQTHGNMYTDRKYLFATRLYFWENESVQCTADNSLKYLEIGCSLGFAALFLHILSYNTLKTGIWELFKALSVFGNLIATDQLPQFMLILYQSVCFSLMFFIGIYAGISAMTLMAFREVGLNLKFPLKNFRTGDSFIEELGNFSITISLFTGSVYGLSIPFLFSGYSQSNLLAFIALLIAASAFIFGIFFLNAYGPHKLIVNTKKIWATKLQKLLEDEKTFEGQHGKYKKYQQTYKDVLNLHEWTIAPPVMAKLIASILIPFIGYFLQWVFESYII